MAEKKSVPLAFIFYKRCHDLDCKMKNVTRSHEETKYRRYNDRVSQSVFHRDECLIQYAYFTHSCQHLPSLDCYTDNMGKEQWLDPPLLCTDPLMWLSQGKSHV
ncbi:hypothetical protein J6590_028933 [Homalodisca vitripennis]|nr:hypothetical protein J6590_028933 [Homalodisca vitripennis]